MRQVRIVFFVIFFGLFSVLHAQKVKPVSALKVVGTQLTDSIGNPVVLRGMSFGWHCFWPRFYNAGAVSWLHKNWGCSVVRAAMGVEPPNGYVSNPEDSKIKIKAVVDAAINEGMYVIIDFHSHHIRTQEAKQFFTEMANTYGKFPNVIYEIFNEPASDDWPHVKTYSEEIIKTIRAIDANNIILVGSPHWDQDVHLPAADPIKNVTNIMYTMHFYAGTHKQWLRDRTDSAISKGLPIFISESAGMEASGDGALDEKEWSQWIAWAEKRKLSWITWSVSDKDETCSVLQKTAASNGRWKKKDLKLSGIKTKAMILKYNKQKAN